MDGDEGRFPGRGPCERWRDAVSARLDGEDPGVDLRLLDAHLARCPACRAFAAAADAAAPRPRRTAVAVPDLSRRVARLAAATDRAGSSIIARGLLAVVAIEIVVVSLPALVLGDEQDTARHAARHLGAFTVAYAVGLLVVVARPARARTMLPVAAVLGGALLIGAVVDLAEGRIPLVHEALHVPELVSVVLLWLLAAPGPRRVRRHAVAPVDLRVVPDPERRRDAG